MAEEQKRPRVQAVRREATRRLADVLDESGVLDLDELNTLIQEESDVVEWATHNSQRSKSTIYVSSMKKAAETAGSVVATLRRAGKLYQNDKPIKAAELLREVAVTGSKVSKRDVPRAENDALLYLEYLSKRDVEFQQWLKDGRPDLTAAKARPKKTEPDPKPFKVRRSSSKLPGSSNRPEDY